MARCCADLRRSYVLGTALAAAPKVIVGLVQPVFAGWIENIKIDGVLKGPGFMGHVRWDAQHLTRAHYDLLAVDGKLQRALEDVGDLLIVMMMQRHVRALLQKYPRKHDFVAD